VPLYQVCYDKRSLGQTIACFDTKEKCLIWINQNPPNETVFNVITLHRGLNVIGHNHDFSWDVYNAELKEQEWAEEYLKRTGKVSVAPEKKDQETASFALPDKQADDFTGEKLNVQSALKLFGIALPFKLSVLKKLYRTLMKESHPDKVSQMSPELRALAEKKAKMINEAYNLVTPLAV
jgi:hypothetical protein